MFKKLRNKILFFNMSITSLVMLTAFSLVYLTAFNNAETEIKQKLENISGSFIVNETVNPQTEETWHFERGEASKTVNKMSDYTPSFTVTVDKNGNITEINSFINLSEELYFKAAEAALSAEKSSKDNQIIIADRIWKYKITEASVTRINFDGISRVEYSDSSQIHFLDITDTRNALKSILLIFLSVGACMLGVIFFVSLIYANRSIKPVEETWEKQKRFIADASHELKTPLTTIMTNCDVLEANKSETINSQKEWLDYIKIGTDRMNKLINNLLLLARTESMDVREAKQSFDAVSLVNEIIQYMEAAATAKHLNISKNIDISGEIISYKNSVEQIITILYENAVKYTDEFGSISVTISRVRKSVILSIKNTGKGISEKDLPHIFDRFYRADTARSFGESDKNSYGLGLPIAKSAAEQIGGKITVQSAENAWTEFKFILPF